MPKRLGESVRFLVLIEFSRLENVLRAHFFQVKGQPLKAKISHVVLPLGFTGPWYLPRTMRRRVAL